MNESSKDIFKSIKCLFLFGGDKNNHKNDHNQSLEIPYKIRKKLKK